MSESGQSTQPRFDYQKFLSLSESDLVAYMEPIVNDASVFVDPRDLDNVATNLASFDEYHLVYAIELYVDHMHSLFGLPVGTFLTHHGQSVRLAAHRALSRLPSAAITDDLIDACRAAIQSGAPVKEVGDLPDILRRRRGQEPLRSSQPWKFRSARADS